MFNTIARFAAVAALGTMIAGCGSNPFGPGYAGGLSIFAKIAQAVQKPAAVNNKDQSKESAQGAVEGGAMAKRLAKTAATPTLPPGVDSNGVQWRGDTLVYFEIVSDKQNENDPQKWSTGRAEVGVRYTGERTITQPDQVVAASITGIFFWKFDGFEKSQKWNGMEVCSLKAFVKFETPTIGDTKPGYTSLWGRNISADIALGKDDTTKFDLTSVVGDTQSGTGSYYDAHTGSDNSGEPSSFNYNIRILHMGTFSDYSDNQGILEFVLPWGKSDDSLHFSIHFFPDHWREGTIKDNSGKVRVQFRRQEHTNEGWTHDENGNDIN